MGFAAAHPKTISAEGDRIYAEYKEAIESKASRDVG